MKERRERLGLFFEARRCKRGRSWTVLYRIIPSFVLRSFPLSFSYLSLSLSHPFFSPVLSFFLSSTCSFCQLSALSHLSLRERFLQIHSAAPSWVATATAVPGSTTRTNIKPETAIRRPENGSSPRTSPYAADACVAFKPTPKPTPYLTCCYLAPVLRITPVSHTLTSLM